MHDRRIWRRYLRLARARRAWLRISRPLRDAIIVIAITAIIWTTIERNEWCDRLFGWIAANPDSEVDSILLAFLLGSIGITICALRRYSEMREASRARDIAEKHVHTLAYHDPLTGLFNRRALNERLDILQRSTERRSSALIFVDLDRFKCVNDVHGHIAGDRLLLLVAERMQNATVKGQTVFRLGGDEFAILVDMCDTEDDSGQTLARRIVASMAESFRDGGLVHHIGASAGIALFPSDAQDADALIRAADVALYRAKNAGRGQHRSYEMAMDDQIKQRAVLEREMRAGIGQGEFCPFYQPLVDLTTGATIGFELLARWIRRDGRDVGPDTFIPIAEECGLIGDLMLTLLDRACRDAREWNPELTIAINISPVQLKDPWLSQKILGCLSRNGFAPQRISIEITENAIIADEENARLTIELLKNQGMRIGLDDFGTGYSSLHHLRVLPFDKIKIDKSFIYQLGDDDEALKIVRAIIGLALSMELPVIAEGIESVEVARILRTMGCAQGQGYLYGRAVAADEIGRLLALPLSATSIAVSG